MEILTQEENEHFSVLKIAPNYSAAAVPKNPLSSIKINISSFVSVKIAAVTAEKKLQQSGRQPRLLHHAQFPAAATTT